MARRREWQDFIINDDVGSDTVSIENLLRGDVNETKGMTLIRTIIRLDVHLILFGGNNGQQVVSMGIGMFSTQAEAAGTASLAAPNVAIEKPLTGWLWRSVGVVPDDMTPGYPWFKIDEDIRAQRKVMYGSPSLLIFNGASGGTAFSITVSGIIRCLYLQD